MKTFRVFIEPQNYFAVEVQANTSEEAEEMVSENLADYYDQLRNVDLHDLNLNVVGSSVSC